MKASIILFSPSGNTLKVGNLLKEELENNSIKTQLINVTAEKEFFSGDKAEFLKKHIEPHDILFVGAPVYAHHFQYHALDLIRALPLPDEIWGTAAVPFVTFGGLNSGIALDEAGQLLRERGRLVCAGIKVASSHRMTRAFLETELNAGLPEKRMVEPIHKLVESLQSVPFADHCMELKYQSEEVYRQANAVFIEKKCHENMYPEIQIDPKQCSGCGTCVKSCPVLNLGQTEDGSIKSKGNNSCIHCFNCIVFCCKNAISANGDLEQARIFMANMVSKGMENPGVEIYPNSIADFGH